MAAWCCKLNKATKLLSFLLQEVTTADRFPGKKVVIILKKQVLMPNSLVRIIIHKKKTFKDGFQCSHESPSQ